ncbi:nicotinate-nucleotide adenylyltransferase [Bacillus sp. JCM 19046]|nr:nicotinate-nucleotide adenylyltransferase [Bacillus sp. JCM 19045]GAF17959.1 nicotinate-nucleotide adenylyltransferase [Bacillus sp. JCM 19046]
MSSHEHNQEKRIGLFGGTFDPPHLGHMLIAQEALSELKLDEIWFIPVSTPPHKERQGLTSGENRFRMLTAATQNENRFKVSDIELKRKGKSFTIDTVKQLKEMHQNHHFYFLIGGDMVDMLDQWYQIDELKKLVTFVAFNRPGAAAIKKKEVEFIPFIDVNISSTIIRKRVFENKPIRYFVSAEVEQVIKEYGLYEFNG